MRSVLPAIVCSAVLLAGTLARAEVYYVAKNGDNANPGTEESPWLTIQKAATSLVAGDTVYVKTGLYDEKIRFANGGTSDAYITYKAHDNEVYISYSGTDDHAVLFTKPYIVLDGFRITTAKYQPVRLNPGAHHVTVRNCELYDTTYHGLLIESDAVHHVTIQNNVIHGNGIAKLHHGMYIKVVMLPKNWTGG